SWGVAAICWRRSGEALSRVQFRPSPLTANEDCVRTRTAGLPRRASAQLRQLQLICGRPPPAADPRTLISMELSPRAYRLCTKASGGRDLDRRDLSPDGLALKACSGLVQFGRQITRHFHADVLFHHFRLMPVLHAILHVVCMPVKHKPANINPRSSPYVRAWLSALRSRPCLFARCCDSQARTAEIGAKSAAARCWRQGARPPRSVD